MEAGPLWLEAVGWPPEHGVAHSQGVRGVADGAWNENRPLYDNSKSSVHIETRFSERFRTWTVHWRQRYSLIGHPQIRYSCRNKHRNSVQQHLPLAADNNNNHHHSVVSLKPGPLHLPKRVLHIMRTSALSLIFQQPLVSLRSSSSCLLLFLVFSSLTFP